MNIVMDPQTGQPFLGNGPMVGSAAIQDTASKPLLTSTQYQGSFPKGNETFVDRKITRVPERFQLIAIKVPSRGEPHLTGDVIVDARQDFSPNGSPEISMTMNSEGAREWRRLTAANIEKSIAIVLDDYVYSYPTVQNEISGGRSSITGTFTLQKHRIWPTFFVQDHYRHLQILLKKQS
jgi:SecD/SecF fusion protein